MLSDIKMLHETWQDIYVQSSVVYVCVKRENAVAKLCTKLKRVHSLAA